MFPWIELAVEKAVSFQRYCLAKQEGTGLDVERGE
jgi:hypothetical protein